ncbi:MAG: SRPBCC family protein [Myxococcales bacterium]|nr:SRPBCC family protein [Myxococcales bacterium]
MKNLGHLKVTLPADTDILLTRVFDAPRHLVWRCITEPALMKQWYGPRGHEMTLSEIDLRVGGAWRSVSRGPNGREVGFRGIYKEISPPERLVCTESFDDYPGDSLVTITLVESEGKTTFTLLGRYPSKEVRDIVIKSGMEHGAAESYDRLNELVVTLS